MSTHPAAGNARGAVPGEKPQPCTKVWSSHAMHATCNADAKKEPSRRSDAGDYELRDGSPTHSQVNAQIVGTGKVSLDATAPWPELFVPQRPRRLLSTAVHNQYRCGAYCTVQPLTAATITVRCARWAE